MKTREKFPLNYEFDDNGQLHLFLKDGTLIIDLKTYKKLSREVKKWVTQKES